MRKIIEFPPGLPHNEKLAYLDELKWQLIVEYNASEGGILSEAFKEVYDAIHIARENIRGVGFDTINYTPDLSKDIING